MSYYLVKNWSTAKTLSWPGSMSVTLSCDIIWPAKRKKTAFFKTLCEGSIMLVSLRGELPFNPDESGLQTFLVKDCSSSVAVTNIYKYQNILKHILKKLKHEIQKTLSTANAPLLASGHGCRMWQCLWGNSWPLAPLERLAAPSGAEFSQDLVASYTSSDLCKDSTNIVQKTLCKKKKNIRVLASSSGLYRCTIVPFSRFLLFTFKKRAFLCFESELGVQRTPLPPLYTPTHSNSCS